MEAIGRLKEKATRHGRDPSDSPHHPARSCRPSQHDLIPAAPRRAPAPHLDVGQPTPRRPPPRCRRCWRAGPAATPPLLPSPLRVGRAALGGRSSVGRAHGQGQLAETQGPNDTHRACESLQALAGALGAAPQCRWCFVHQMLHRQAPSAARILPSLGRPSVRSWHLQIGFAARIPASSAAGTSPSSILLTFLCANEREKKAVTRQRRGNKHSDGG